MSASIPDGGTRAERPARQASASHVAGGLRVRPFALAAGLAVPLWAACGALAWLLLR